MAENFYKLLHQRIAEHAEKDLARYGICLNHTPAKPITRQRKWLDKFKAIHGMSYSTWLYRQKHSHPAEETSDKPVEPQAESPIEQTTAPMETPMMLPQETPIPVLA